MHARTERHDYVDICAAFGISESCTYVWKQPVESLGTGGRSWGDHKQMYIHMYIYIYYIYIYIYIYIYMYTHAYTQNMAPGLELYEQHVQSHPGFCEFFIIVPVSCSIILS